MSKNLSYLSDRQGIQNNLFEQLGIASQNTGTPNAEEMERLQNEFLFGKANIYGTVSFYDFLKEENKGKKIYVCNGSACMTAGTQENLKNKISAYFKDEEIGEMCCLGRCHENHAFHYNGKNYSGHSVEMINSIHTDHHTIADNYHTAHSGTAVITKKYPHPT